MKKFLLFVILLVLVFIGYFYIKDRYIIGRVEDVNEYAGTAIITPLEMSPANITSGGSLRIKTDIDVEIGDTIKVNIKPSIRYFFKTIFKQSIRLAVSPESLSNELEYSIEIIKK